MSSKHEVFNDDLDMALAQNLKLAADLLAVTSERDELRAEIERLQAFVQKVALYSNDAWLAREADELAPGAKLKP